MVAADRTTNLPPSERADPHLLPHRRHRSLGRLLREARLRGARPAPDSRRGDQRLHGASGRRRAARADLEQGPGRAVRSRHRLRPHRRHRRRPRRHACEARREGDRARAAAVHGEGRRQPDLLRPRSRRLPDRVDRELVVKVALVALVAAIGLIATGCGSKSSGSSLETALSYVPRNAPVVIAIDTNPDGDQWQQVDHLLGKFPFGGQVKQQVKGAFNSRANVDYDKDIRPLLGNDMVLAITGASAANSQTPYVFAWKLKDESAAR